MKKIKSTIQILILIVGIFSFAYFAQDFVSGEDLSSGKVKCCEKTVEGAVCQNVASSEECAEGLHEFTSCELTSSCKLGCCIDEEQGIYDKNVPKISCSKKWVADKNCNVPGARFGCCDLGDKTAFVTENRCKYLADFQGVSFDWRRDLNEIECVGLSMVQDEGACVYSGGCDFTTYEKCLRRGGNFYKDYLCTASVFETDCEPTQNTMCVEGKDEVYFQDSCGNRANIYDASKVNQQGYWEKVVPKNQACGFDDENGNAESETCGNCNLFLGGVCSSAAQENFNPQYGDYFCKSTSCLYRGKVYKNGESWCIYEGKIGNGDDVVGSRHYKYVCNQGEIQIEPCADYRNEICVQDETDLEGTEKNFTSASCRINHWRICSTLTSGSTKKCLQEPDCMVKSVSLGKYFDFNLCVPKYPPGFSFDETGQKTATQTCAVATMTCEVPMERDGSKCKPAENKGCLTEEFAIQMNELCKSLGDCGMEVNVEGKFSRGSYSVSGAPGLPGSYVSYLKAMANPENFAGQFAPVGNLTKYLVAAGILGFSNSYTKDLQQEQAEQEEENEKAQEIGTYIGTGAGGVGLAIRSYSFIAAGEEIGLGLLFKSFKGFAPGKIPAWLGGFSNVAMSIGWIVGFQTLIVSLSGIEATQTGMIVGAVVGVATYLIATTLILQSALNSALVSGAAYTFGEAFGLIITGAGTVSGPIGWVVGGVAIAVAVIVTSLFSDDLDELIFGECEPKYVTYTCKPWHPPVGGDDCDKCNDELGTCSEYKCKSLGAACEFINKGTQDELCYEKDPYDTTPPKIQPDLDSLPQGLRYEKISNLLWKIKSDAGCLDAYSLIPISLKTDEPALCRFDLQEKDFEETEFDLGSAYLYNHSIVFPLPDPSHGQSMGLNWSGDVNLYVKCEDTHGNIMRNYFKIEMCVNQGPDETPPIIQNVFPPKDSLLAYNATLKSVLVYTNEPANCKWSLQDKNYEEMENSFECENNIAQMTAFGYLCYGNLNLSSEKNSFYFKCKDQPWLEKVNKSEKRNANVESYKYVLNRVKSKIKIDWIKPDEGIKILSSPATVILEVKTSNGGKLHSCDYSFSGYDYMIDFYDFDFNNIHKQEFNQIVPGDYKIYVECKDETGVKVRGETEFKVYFDTAIPLVARVYSENGKLKLVTNEESECAYDFESCDFDFESGTDFGDGLTHVTTFRQAKTYYIKCKDEFGNAPDDCSIIVRKGDI